jgi:toxin-antitoxin system PIN domain toxin
VILCDVNVLVYAHREESPEHDAYARLLIGLATGQEPFGCSELVLGGFVRVVTNPRVFRDPTPLEKALAFTGELLAQPTCTRLRPGPRHWDIFTRLCSAVGARGKLVADAYHAALAIEYGCEWLSADSDFARFSGLRWRHPLQA